MKGIAANYNLDLDLEAFLCSSSFWSRISVRCEWSHSTFNFVFGARPGSWPAHPSLSVHTLNTRQILVVKLVVSCHPAVCFFSTSRLLLSAFRSQAARIPLHNILTILWCPAASGSGHLRLNAKQANKIYSHNCMKYCGPHVTSCCW